MTVRTLRTAKEIADYVVETEEEEAVFALQEAMDKQAGIIRKRRK